jgi:hypothetical protein
MGNPDDANIMLLICTVAGLPALDPAAAHNGGSGAAALSEPGRVPS